MSQFENEPDTAEEIRDLHHVLRTDPHRYLDITSAWIARNPSSSNAYYSRHEGWLAIGEPQRALDDLNQAIAFRPEQIDFFARGQVHRHLGDYVAAAADFSHAESLQPEVWQDMVVPLLYQADTHARLGDEVKALDCCARLPASFWSPGPNNLPAGGPQEIGARLRLLAEDATRRR